MKIPDSDKDIDKKRADHHSKVGTGLNVEIHPALLSENVNLIRHRDNPYLSHETPSTVDKKVAKRYSRGLKFHTPGALTKRLQEERAQIAKEQELQKERDEIKKAKVRSGELPDELIGEQNYLINEVPEIEWWDAIYVNNLLDWSIKEKYTKEAETMDIDSEEGDDSGSELPTIRYVQHPVPLQSEPTTLKMPKVYLVKREQKKLRRNRRKLLREEHEQKVRLGLEPKPAPKVKLSNMMNVYQNTENITDPTSWEQTVKAGVEERHKKHVETNLRRHFEAKERKQEKSAEKSSSPTDLCCRVFRFTGLRNPKIRFKLAKNSRQLGMRGVCLRVGDGPGILVVIGTEKNCRFYSKLVLQRLKWSEPYVDSATNQLIDCSKDKSELVWEGILKETKFRGWFMKQCESEDELKSTLAQFDADWLNHL